MSKLAHQIQRFSIAIRLDSGEVIECDSVSLEEVRVRFPNGPEMVLADLIVPAALDKILKKAGAITHGETWLSAPCRCVPCLDARAEGRREAEKAWAESESRARLRPMANEVRILGSSASDAKVWEESDYEDRQLYELEPDMRFKLSG